MRGEFLTAKVAVSGAALSYDELYSYHVPKELEDQAVVGSRVLVPFGKNNRRTIGFIARTYRDTVYNEVFKPVIAVLDSESLVTDELMRIIFWLRENTFCTYFDAYKSVVPAGFSYSYTAHYELANTYINEEELGEEELQIVRAMQTAEDQKSIDEYLDFTRYPRRKRAVESLVDKGYIEENGGVKRRIGDESVRMISLDEQADISAAKLTPKQKLVVKLLEESGTVSVKEACYMTGCTEAIIKRLKEKNVINEYRQEVMRDAVGEITERVSPDSIILSDEQHSAFEGIMELIGERKPAGALLYGVTGSGKTSVFIKVIDEVLKSGRNAMLLVPEISLTPQTVSRFRSLFGENIALLHSSLSLGQRTDEFKRIKRGQARIVIGTRSAVFAPVSDLGVIIIDEEGEQSYKSDRSPRYHARDVAIQRCGHNSCVLLMASATPSLETFYYAKNHRFHLFELRQRYSNAVLPQVEIVDMQREQDSLFSRSLIDSVNETLDRKEQVILLLNRRGFTTYISCMDCRQPIVCPSCNIPLTYHKKNDRYMCHYCGYTMDNLGKCPSCGSDKLRACGVGTQRVEDEVARLFPKARVLRMDADTTSSRYAYEEKFRAFGEHEYDIMLGTQMIAKGLDFPRVTLVGVISLDKALFTGDYKSYERTFSLMTQVVGRSGRGERRGKAVVQTFVPDHFVLNLAAQQDYDRFYEEEIALRQALTYPPFCDICVIGFSAVMESRAIQAGKFITEQIREYIRQNEVDFPMRAIGPGPCTLENIGGRYRYRLILKVRNTPKLREMIRYVLSGFYKNRELKDVRIYADLGGEIGL